MNAYEKGRPDARNGVKKGNPYEEFSSLWAQYNMGYNSIFLAALNALKK